MCACQRQNVRYIILCTLLGLTQSLPVSDGIVGSSPRPTTTTDTVKTPLLDSQTLLAVPEYAIDEDFNSIFIVQPVLDQPNTLESTITDVHKQRARRTLTTAQLNQPLDLDLDMELAEVNVFRPLFRYRAEIARNVGRRQQG
ncbi:uncharacterized protein LOC101450696 [Ceratitis capitata]|uniref:uncharacterized protein LOC101450696 n=1 Tax=Ceratitis capitata TaxID=7213 RepID=UPI0003298974|nr:uncharacterized protein LOC101450696 [Ceratitis capitata]